MTNLSDTLAALSEAATDADREAAAALYDALFPHNDLRAVNIRLGNIDDGTAVQAFAAHRRNVIAEAIRTGQLVPVPSVEGIMEVVNPHCLNDHMAQEIATAVIAAMKEGKP